MRFLVTAGPTREHLDDVRFISNASSGRMGYAIARAALKAGHHVDLISGPVSIKPPSAANLICVTSTQQMYKAALKLFPQSDCLIGAAAPADFRPARRARGKQAKGKLSPTLQLKPTVDILATLGKKKREQLIIAFALESQRPVTNALAKLRRKNADAIVLNAPSAMEADRSRVSIFLKDGTRAAELSATKNRIARTLVTLAEKLYKTRS